MAHSKVSATPENSNPMLPYNDSYAKAEETFQLVQKLLRNLSIEMGITLTSGGKYHELPLLRLINDKVYSASDSLWKVREQVLEANDLLITLRGGQSEETEGASHEW